MQIRSASCPSIFIDGPARDPTHACAGRSSSIVVRSPFGAGGQGARRRLHPVDLYALVLSGLVAGPVIDPQLIEDVITGCVIQVAEQGQYRRQAVLAAGLPESVPAVTWTANAARRSRLRFRGARRYRRRLRWSSPAASR